MDTFKPLEDPEGTKVIILPQSDTENGEYEVIMLLNGRTLRPTKFLFNSTRNQLLELKSFNGKNSANPHISKSTMTMRDGHVVKSLVFHGDTDGLVLEHAEMLIATQFNFVYVLIGFYERTLESMTAEEGYKLRLLNLEDLIESLEMDEVSLGSLPRSFFNPENKTLVSAIDLIFERFEENDESYYKLSPDKIVAFLKSKVEALAGGNFPQSLYRKLITEKLTPPPSVTGNGSGDEEIPADAVRGAKLSHAINIVSSYISPLLTEKLTQLYAAELAPLAAQKNKIRLLEERQKLAEENLRELNSNLQLGDKKRSVPNGAPQKPGASKKKAATPKVAVGKGALDGFFKRA